VQLISVLVHRSEKYRIDDVDAVEVVVVDDDDVEVGVDAGADDLVLEVLLLVLPSLRCYYSHRRRHLQAMRTQGRD
jgi:hypothetical protein